MNIECFVSVFYITYRRYYLLLVTTVIAFFLVYVDIPVEELDV